MLYFFLTAYVSYMIALSYKTSTTFVCLYNVMCCVTLSTVDDEDMTYKKRN